MQRPSVVAVGPVLGFDLDQHRAEVVFLAQGRRSALVDRGDHSLLLLGGNAHRSAQVGLDMDKAVLTLELGRDGLDQRLLLEGLEHCLPRLEHQLKKLLLVILGVVREQDVGEELVVRFS